MGMVVRTNTMALNAYRQLGMNNSAVAKSLEKLSSGFRINRAGDDAAGLAISEKMKAQITGLEAASANAQDGISLIQTAEGNLTEVHSMLNRMVELATKSANGTYTSTERDALQDEVDALLDEIDRISQSANFNGTRLLDGTMGLNKDAFTIGNITPAAAGEKITIAGLTPSTSTDTAKLHLNTAGKAQQGASFVVDLADYTAEIGATGVAGTKFSVTVAGTDFESATIDGTQTTNQKKYTGSDIAKSIFDNANNWAGGTGAPADTATEKHVVIDGAVYKATLDGTRISFTYAGDTNNGAAAKATDVITDDMLDINANLGNEVKVTVTNPTGVTTTGAPYHGLDNVVKAEKAVQGQRAGIELDLTQMADLFKDGSQLTIDGKTFTFKLDANSSYEGDVIDLSGVKGAGATPTTAEYAAAAAAQLSGKLTGHFEITDAGAGKIKVDQTVADYNNGANAPYTKYEDLTVLFSANKAGTGASIDLTVDASKISSGDAIKIGDKTYTFVKEASTTPSTDPNKVEVLLGENNGDAVNNLIAKLANDNLTATANGDVLTITAAAGKDAPAIIGGGLTLQIGDTADAFNKMTVAVADMSAKGLGLENINITSETLASQSIDKIKTAINTVSTARAGMGALQNRLEHTINNLDVAVENLSAANSRIRDTDMAKEMMNYTKMNVLVQSAQAMLAQANQQPQSVLQLLQ